MVEHMRAGDNDAAQVLITELHHDHPHQRHDYDLAIVNGYLDIITPTNERALDAHLDDVGD